MATGGIQGQLLDITVVGCFQLRDTEWISRQDPYVCMEYANNRFRTKTCTDGGKNPSFNEKFVLRLIEGLREINVSVWNSNTVTTDDLIGSGTVLLDKVISSGYDDSTWPLQTKRGKNGGQVRLILHYANAGVCKVKVKCNLILQLLHIHAICQLVVHIRHQQDTHHINSHLLSILDIRRCRVIKHHQLLHILRLLVMCILLLQLTTLRQVLDTHLLHMELLHQHTLQLRILRRDHKEHIRRSLTQAIIQDHNHLWSFYRLLGRCMAGEARKGRGYKGIVCCREDSVQLVLIEMTLSIICFSDICWSGSVFFFPSLRIVLLVTFPIPLRIDTWQIYSARFIVLSNSFKWNGVNKLEIVLTATLNLLEFAQVVAFALKVSIKGTSKCMNLICVRE